LGHYPLVTKLLPVLAVLLTGCASTETTDRLFEVPTKTASSIKADDPESTEAKITESDADLLLTQTPRTKTPLTTVNIDDFKEMNPKVLAQEGEAQGEQPSIDINLATGRAERGDVESQLALATAYANGHGVEKDLEQAKLWFELASMQGNSTAQYELGQLFYMGQGVRKDYFNAREWWMESAQAGNIDAQQKIGYLYSEGLGVDRDFEQAKLWYTKAANGGHAEAQTLLGSLYHEGNRITHNYVEAFKWYKLAAEQGHAHAQYTLATLYHDGLGTQVDYIQCAAWVDVAVANGFFDEHKAGETCRAELDDITNQTATQLGNAWKQKYTSPSI